MTLRPGLELLSEQVGDGPLVRRHAHYRIRRRVWLSDGALVRWDQRWHWDHVNGVADDGVTLYNEVRVDRRSLNRHFAMKSATVIESRQRCS
jgi:hypothetical protein